MKELKILKMNLRILSTPESFLGFFFLMCLILFLCTNHFSFCISLLCFSCTNSFLRFCLSAEEDHDHDLCDHLGSDTGLHPGWCSGHLILRLAAPSTPFYSFCNWLWGKQNFRSFLFLPSIVGCRVKLVH